MAGVFCGFAKAGVGAVVALTVAVSHDAQAETAAPATFAALVVRPHEDAAAQCQSGIDWLARVGAQRLAELGARKAFHESFGTVLDLQEALLTRYWSDRVSASQARLTAGEVLSKFENGVVAEFGTNHTVEKLVADMMRERERAGEARVEMVSGDYVFRLEGLGKTTRSGLADRVSEDARAIAELEADLAEGSWEARLGPLGWVSRTELEDCLRTAHERAAKALGALYAGEDPRDIIGLGDSDADAMKARVERLREEVRKIEAEFDSGAYRLHRPILGGARDRRMSRSELEDRLAGIDAEISDRQRAIAAGEFEIHLPGWDEWRTADDLRTEVADLEGLAQDLGRAVAAGTYRVTLPMNKRWNRNEIEARLATDRGISDGLAAQLRQGLADIRIMSELELADLSRGIDRRRHYLGLFPALADGAVRERQTERQAWAAHLRDFEDERQAWRAQIDREIAVLEGALTLLP